MSTASSCPSCHGRKQLRSACAFCGKEAGKAAVKKNEEEEKSTTPSSSSSSSSSQPVPSSGLSSVTENMVAVSDQLQPSNCRACRRRAALIATSRGNFCSKACMSTHAKKKSSSANPKESRFLSENMAELLESLGNLSEEEQEQEKKEEKPQKKPDSAQRYELFHQSVDYAVDWTRWYPSPGPLRLGIFALPSHQHLQLTYTQHGENGPILLLLPALGLSRYEFRDFQVLCAPFCRSVAVDLLNTGASSRLNEEERHLLQQEPQILRALMEHLYPGERYHVIGSEWGGVTALQLAHESQSLTLLNPIPELREAGISRKIQAINECTAFWESSTLRSVPYMGAAHCAPLEEYMKEEFHKSSNVPLYQYDGYLADRTQALSQWKLLPRHPTLNPSGVDLPSDLPTFLVYGCKGDALSETVANSLPAQYGLSTYVIQKLCDARHLLALDQPVALAQFYLHFLRGVAHQKLAIPYLGFPATFKGDEPAILWITDTHFSL